MKTNTQSQKVAKRAYEIRPIRLSDLRLDPQNPRLPEEVQDNGLSQEQLLEIHIRYFALKDLGRSFADYGYFPQDPMAVVGPAADGTYTVVEGNRRLAALRLLTEAKVRRKFGDDEWEELVSTAQKQNLDTIPAIISASRRELTSFLGFRHVSGVLSWGPIEKARFIHHLIQRDKLDFRQAARAIGSRTDAVRQLYVAYRIIVQAREQFGIDPDGAVNNFGVFYRSLSTAGIRQFIGFIGEKRTPKQCYWPVPKSKRERLKEVFNFLFGDHKHSAVITNSRQLTKLGAVLASKPAFEHLRANRQLDAAYELSEGEENRLIDQLEHASFSLDQALRDVHRHHDSAAVALRVKRCCGSLREIAKHFPEIYREYFIGERNV